MSSTEPKSSLYQVELPVTVVAGRATLSLNDLSAWTPDSVIPLDVAADQPLELCVNGKVVATGEFCEDPEAPSGLAVRVLDIKQMPEAE
ncbi:MAG: FliM/FliN family flagellar motor switch protein [Parvularcula sp.]